MKTRFDNEEYWIKADGTYNQIENMETSHLLNILNMFVTKPKTILSMLIMDIERQTKAWGPYCEEEVVHASLGNVSSMSFASLTEYALASPLGQAMTNELKDRGVNVKNFVNQIVEDMRKETK